MSDDDCRCGRIHIGLKVTEHRNWNPDCPIHPWDDRLQTQADRAVEMQRKAAEARYREARTVRLEDNVGRLRSEVIAAALDWYEWEAAHAPDGGPDDPHDLRLYQLLADPAVRAVLARYREARR